jgi:hypothetical protein
MPDLIWLSIVLCLIVGAAIDTSNICLLRATINLTMGNASMIIGIIVVTTSASAVYYLNTEFSLHHRLSAWAYPTWTTLAGTALFVSGTILNDCCAIGTVGKIARGDIGHLATFAGALSVTWLIPPMQLDSQVPNLPLMRDLNWLIVVLTFATVAIIVGRHHIRGQRMAPYLLLGVTAAFLTDWQGNWTWISVFERLRFGMHSSLLALVFFAAVLLGATLTAWHRGHFKLLRPEPIKILREVLGGGLMLAGAFLIPGANDVLSVYGVPSGSPDAVIGYLVMFVLMLTAVRIKLLISRDQATKAQ